VEEACKILIRNHKGRDRIWDRLHGAEIFQRS
jgi:hypothetical protein